MLIEGMRDVGYTLESALADIVDNSIAAHAESIEILAETDGAEPRIGILDDGDGMDAADLLEAMRLGNRGPIAGRASGDLGRFGLGLKTASFSQCRRMTVVTRKNGTIATARWDLDTVESLDDWIVELPEGPDFPWIDRLRSSGTLVLWEKLDRLTAGGGEQHDQRLVRRLDEAATHLELVFHRFLAGDRGMKRLSIGLNDRPLEPFDPFHSRHPATMPGPLETIRIGAHRITIQAFTLPHHKMVTPADWDRYGGPAGYVKNQGFYVYRGGRLIIYGTWFGLARQMELTKLARVRIDIPTGLDEEWKIDIKKASAQLPAQVRKRLQHLIEAIGAPSKRVYTVRGRRLVEDNVLPMWRRLQDKNEIRYCVNLEHPVVLAYRDKLPEDLRSDFIRVLEVVGASIPIDSVFADTGGQPDQVMGQSISNGALDQATITSYNHLLSLGLANTDIVAILRSTEPFRSNWEVAQRMLPPQMNETGSDV